MADANPIMLPGRQKGPTPKLPRQFLRPTPPLLAQPIEWPALRVIDFDHQDRPHFTGSLDRLVGTACHGMEAKSASLWRRTALSDAFATLLPILSDYVGAEQLLEQIDCSQDPAYRMRNATAEHAQDRLIDVLYVLRTLPFEAAEDIPLRRMAFLLTVMRGCNGAEVRRLHQLMEDNFDQVFSLPGNLPGQLHRKLLLQWTRPLVASFVALSFLDNVCVEEDDAYDSETFYDETAYQVFSQAFCDDAPPTQQVCCSVEGPQHLILVLGYIRPGS